jgi:hypothetical protein
MDEVKQRHTYTGPGGSTRGDQHNEATIPQFSLKGRWDPQTPHGSDPVEWPARRPERAEPGDPYSTAHGVNSRK